jgi:alcohol dehydrogenase
VAITTTSGTGSQCTCFSVITNPKTHQKPGMGAPHILPRVAIVDPELMLSVPPGLTLVTGFDVFTHAVEAYTSKASSPLSDLFAERAISLLAKNLPTAYANGSDLEARAAMALADTCSGIAICHAVVSLGHVMAHVISGHFHDIAHGDALYSVYRGVLEHNASSLPEKHAWVAGQLLPGCRDIVKAFDTFFAPFPFENKLKARKIGPEKIHELAADTFTYMKGIADLNPAKAEVADARRILTAAVG